MVKKQADLRLAKETMLVWLDASHEQTVYKQMAKIHSAKVYREIYSAWNLVRIKNNAKRRNLYRIKR